MNSRIELTELLHNPQAKQEMLRELMQATQPQKQAVRKPVTSRVRAGGKQRPCVLPSEEQIEAEYQRVPSPSSTLAR